MWGRARLAALAAGCSLAVVALVAPAARAASTPPFKIGYDTRQNSDIGNPGIYEVNGDGSDPLELVEGGSEPDWSANGSKLLYVMANQVGNTHCTGGGSGGGPMYVANGDGSGPTYVGGTCGDAVISPDGTEVAAGGQTDTIDAWNVASDAEVQLDPVPNYMACYGALGDARDTACGFADDPSFIGNNTVAFISPQSDGGGIWSLPAAGGSNSPAQVADDGSAQGIDYYSYGMSVNPAGKLMALGWSGADGSQQGIWTVPVGGSQGTLLVAAPSGHDYMYPKWSPDGKWLVFEDLGPSGSNIDVLPAAGGTPVDITPNDPTAADPAFAGAPSGATISGTVSDPSGTGLGGLQVAITPSAGGAATTVTTDNSGAYTAQVQPGAYTVSGVGTGPQAATEFTLGQCDGTASGSSCALAVTAGSTSVANFTAAFKLSGIVTDDTGSPASGVTVLIAPQHQGVGSNPTSTTTGSDGRFTVTLGPGGYVAGAQPTTKYFGTASADCQLQNGQDGCLVNLTQDRSIAFSGCVVPDPSGTPLPTDTPNPIPGSVTAGDLEAVGCWQPQNASGDGQATIYTTSQPIRLDGIDVKPTSSGTTFQLDTSGPTVTSNGPAQMLIAGWPITSPANISLNYQGGSTLSVSDQGSANGPLAPNIFGLPLTGGSNGLGLPFSETAGSTSINAGILLPLNTSASWNPLSGTFTNGAGTTIPSVNLNGQITTSNRTGLSGQACAAVKNVPVAPFGDLLADGQITGLQLCWQPQQQLWTGSGQFQMPSAVAKVAGDVYVTVTAQHALSGSLFSGYKLQNFGIQFDHLKSETIPVGELGSVRESGIAIGDGVFLQSVGLGWSNDLATGAISAVTGTIGVSLGPEIRVQAGSGGGNELSLLRGDLDATLLPPSPAAGFWTYSLKGALTFARLTQAELQLGSATVTYHADPSAPEADITAQVGGSLLGIGTVLKVSGQSDVPNGLLLEGAATEKAFGHQGTLDVVQNNTRLGACLTANGQSVLGFVYDLAQPLTAPTWGCDMGSFKHPGLTHAGLTHRASASRQAAVRIKPGLAATVLAVRGKGKAPTVRVTGGGHTINATPGVRPRGIGGAIVFSSGPTTYIGLLHPRAGTWHIKAIGHSPAIAGITEADPLPPTQLTAKTMPFKCVDRVRYHLKAAKGTRVLLYADQGTSHVRVGHLRPGSHTVKMAMTPETKGHGTLVAYELRGKNPAGTLQLGRFANSGANGSERPGVPKLKGTTVKWAPACDAASYTVTITRGTGTTTVTTTAPQLTLPAGSGRAELTIQALDAGGDPLGAVKKTVG